METIGKSFVQLLVTIPGILLRGWITTKLWAWFIVPIFGLPVLGIAPALGLSALVSYLVFDAHKAVRDTVEDKRSFEEKLGHQAVASLVFPFIVLGSGWIIHLFM